jgi:hypothetical protein
LDELVRERLGELVREVELRHRGEHVRVQLVGWCAAGGPDGDAPLRVVVEQCGGLWLRPALWTHTNRTSGTIVGGDRRNLAASFAHSLIPIALAYVIAHYFGLLSYQGRAAVALASDPLDRGWDLFGTANDAVDYTWISATAIWYVQIVTLVTGHVGGLILAHDRAVARWSDPKLALRSQYWMLAIMVGFTCLALWLLSGSAQRTPGGPGRRRPTVHSRVRFSVRFQPVKRARIGAESGPSASADRRQLA